MLDTDNPTRTVFISDPETITVVRIEHEDGTVHEFTLKAHCDRSHTSFGLFDRDYDFVTLSFEHEDASSEPCFGTWHDPNY